MIIKTQHRTIATSEFRAHTARIFDEVANGATYIVTKDGRPTAMISPVPATIEPGYGRATTQLPISDALEPIDID